MRFVRFSDFAKDTALDGDKVKIDSILNKEVVVLAFKVTSSKFKKNGSRDCVTLQPAYPESPEEHFIVFTGSEVLRDQIAEYKEHIPFAAKIVKINKYYTFS